MGMAGSQLERYQPAARVDSLKRVSTNEIEIVVHQGWNRLLRRMAEECGVSVARLIRVREGSIRLEKLEPGQWREVAPNRKRYEARPAPLSKRGSR